MDWAKETLQKPMWKEEIKNREAKEQVAKKMAERVQEGSEHVYSQTRKGIIYSREFSENAQTRYMFYRFGSTGS